MFGANLFIEERKTNQNSFYNMLSNSFKEIVFVIGVIGFHGKYQFIIHLFISAIQSWSEGLNETKDEISSKNR